MESLTDETKDIIYIKERPERLDEVISLYQSVGWTRYTDFPDKLRSALHNSTYVICAYKNAHLIGLIRGLSDAISIHFIQDLLVLPKHQQEGVGRDLIKRALGLYPKIQKHALLTDDEPAQRRFYESLGFQNLDLVQPKLNAYIRMES